jgi:DNA-binding CsgD family transcriptional regulator
VRNYLTRIYEKLDVRSRNEAIIWAREHNFHKK